MSPRSGEPRAYTEDEIRRQFLDHVWVTALYWSRANGGGDALDRITGFAHSMLAAIDGAAASLPAFKLVPDPHPDDKQFHIDEGENYYPDDVDIAGSLHELMYADEIRQDR